MTKMLLPLVLALTGCIGAEPAHDDSTVPALAAVLIFDRACAQPPCAWLATDGAIVDIASRNALQLQVHADDHGLADVTSWTIAQDDTIIELDAQHAQDNSAGSDVTLVVPQLAPGPMILQAQRGDAIETLGCFATDGEISGYGSTYGSSCTCSYCSKWCSTKGGVVYSGTCC